MAHNALQYVLLQGREDSGCAAPVRFVRALLPAT